MAKRTVSFADYEEPTWEEYTGEDPPPNKWFTAVAKRGYWDKEQDQFVIILEISEGDYAGWGKGWYAPLDGDLKWKAQSIIKALQGGVKKDLTLDWENEKAVETWIRTKAKPIKIKTREYNDKISINRVAPLLEAVGAPGAKTTTPKEAELAGDTDAGDEPIEDYTEEELGEMEISDLEEILEEEFEVAKDDDAFPKKGRRDRSGTAYKKAVIDAILDEQDEADDGDDEADGDDDPEFNDGFDDGDGDPEPEPEPEPTPAPRARRSRAAAAKPEPAPAAKPTTTRRRRS